VLHDGGLDQVLDEDLADEAHVAGVALLQNQHLGDRETGREGRERGY
jgi:hypothetical protein